MKQTFKCQERMIYMAKNSARDNAIYVLRIMREVNLRASETGDTSRAIDTWLTLRARYNYHILNHPDFQGLEKDGELYNKLAHIDECWNNPARYNELLVVEDI